MMQVLEIGDRAEAIGSIEHGVLWARGPERDGEHVRLRASVAVPEMGDSSRAGPWRVEGTWDGTALRESVLEQVERYPWFEDVDSRLGHATAEAVHTAAPRDGIIGIGRARGEVGGVVLAYYRWGTDDVVRWIKASPSDAVEVLTWLRPLGKGRR